MILFSYSFQFFSVFFIRKGGFIRPLLSVQLEFCQWRSAYRLFSGPLVLVTSITHHKCS